MITRLRHVLPLISAPLLLLAALALAMGCGVKSRPLPPASQTTTR